MYLVTISGGESTPNTFPAIRNGIETTATGPRAYLGVTGGANPKRLLRAGSKEEDPT